MIKWIKEEKLIDLKLNTIENKYNHIYNYSIYINTYLNYKINNN